MSTNHESTLRVVICREADQYVAQCLEFDIGATASDLETLKERLLVTFMLECRERGGTDENPFPGIPPAPAFYHAKWSECDFRNTPEMVGQGKSQSMQMAMCA